MTTTMNNTNLKEYSLAETKRHKPCLIYCGHRYVQDKIQNRTIYWRCEDRSHCNGRAHQLIGNESLPILTIKHNHPPIVEDLSRHDIVSVDSHRRRRRQNRKILSHYSNEKNDLLSSSTMTSSIKLENNQNKCQRIQQQPQHTVMVKNLHLSEVITTTTPSNIHPYPDRHITVDPNKMTKLINTITTTIPKTTSTSPKIDHLSRLNHFSWEEIEGRYLPVIYRNENNIYQRYTSKMYVENTLFQSEAWQKHSILARSLPPLVSYSYTEYELKLFRNIITWHLASCYFKTIPSTDCLIRFEDLWDFYNTLRKLRDTIPSTRPIAPLPSSQSSQSFEVPISSKQQLNISTSKESGWVQINNVFVPYIIKLKLRENELNKTSIQNQSNSQLQRQYYVPYEILIKCNIFSDQEFLFKKFLIKATQQDFDILNNLITNINIFDEKVPEKTLLVNLYHVMIGLNKILYIKFLPTKQPRTQVNKYHIDVLTHKGGTLLMNGNKLIPYIVQNNRFYVPLLYTFHSLSSILIQAKRIARAPRQYEIDYLNLLFIYFSIDIPSLTSDTLLVDIFNIKCSNLQTPIHFRTLHEHQQYEKTKLLNNVVRSTTTTNKINKYQPANVVVNPMIHHPSFYGLTSPKLLKQSHECKSILYDNHSLNVIIKSSEQSSNDWKISMKEIFQKFSFNIDYDKFIQWCQINLLLPLIKLDDDEEENKLIIQNNDNDYYIYQKHLERCISLLNDLQRGTISMTLLPSPPSQSNIKSSLAGAKKRKTTIPTTRHILPISTNNEMNSNDISMDEQIHCSIIDNHDDDDDDDDDDLMPVVASVEEEQSIEESNTIETIDCNNEKIPSCSSGYESSAVLNPIHEDIGDDETRSTIHSQEHSSSCPSIVSRPNSPKMSSIHQKKITKKRPRNGYVKSRSRARSSISKAPKKRRSIDDNNNNDDENTSLVIVITSDKIQQHLRTLFMTTNEIKRTRTRPIKTPTRLVEEINNTTTTIKTLEPDTNVFDILSSTTDAISQNELPENSQQSCTYNVVISNTPNKLGLTIKKVIQS